MDEELQAMFQQARGKMDVLCAKLSFEEATVRLRNMELEASVHNFVLDNFSTLEFQFLAQLENSENRAKQYKSILSDSQRQLMNSKKVEESLKGSLEACEGELEQLQIEAELAKKAYDAALREANDSNSADVTKQLKRKEAELKKMQKQTEAEKKKLQKQIQSVQNQCQQYEAHNKELQALLDKERESRTSMHMNMTAIEGEAGLQDAFDTEALRKSLHLSLNERTDFEEQELQEDEISYLDLTLEEEQEVFTEPQPPPKPTKKTKTKQQGKAKGGKGGSRKPRKQPIITEIEPVSSDGGPDVDKAQQEETKLPEGGYSSSDHDDELFQTNAKTALIQPEHSEQTIMTRARRRETLPKPPTQQTQPVVKTSKKKKPPLPSRLFSNPMEVINDKVKAACEGNKDPAILTVNPFVIPLPMAGQRRVSGIGAKRKLGPRSINGTVTTGNSELNKEVQDVEDRPRKLQHNLASKKWRM